VLIPLKPESKKKRHVKQRWQKALNMPRPDPGRQQIVFGRDNMPEATSGQRKAHGAVLYPGTCSGFWLEDLSPEVRNI
jgi:hypothetical protein